MVLLHQLILVTIVSLCDVVTEELILHICSHQDDSELQAGRTQMVH
jgi:hypothetical protein